MCQPQWCRWQPMDYIEPCSAQQSCIWRSLSQVLGFSHPVSKYNALGMILLLAFTDAGMSLNERNIRAGKEILGLGQVRENLGKERTVLLQWLIEPGIQPGGRLQAGPGTWLLKGWIFPWKQLLLTVSFTVYFTHSLVPGEPRFFHSSWPEWAFWRLVLTVRRKLDFAPVEGKWHHMLMEQTCRNNKYQQSQPDSLNHLCLDKHPKLLGFQRCLNKACWMQSNIISGLASTVKQSNHGVEVRHEFW